MTYQDPRLDVWASLLKQARVKGDDLSIGNWRPPRDTPEQAKYKNEVAERAQEARVRRERRRERGLRKHADCDVCCSADRVALVPAWRACDHKSPEWFEVEQAAEMWATLHHAKLDAVDAGAGETETSLSEIALPAMDRDDGGTLLDMLVASPTDGVAEFFRGPHRQRSDEDIYLPHQRDGDCTLSEVIEGVIGSRDKDGNYTSTPLGFCDNHRRWVPVRVETRGDGVRYRCGEAHRRRQASSDYKRNRKADTKHDQDGVSLKVRKEKRDNSRYRYSTCGLNGIPHHDRYGEVESQL